MKASIEALGCCNGPGKANRGLEVVVKALAGSIEVMNVPADDLKVLVEAVRVPIEAVRVPIEAVRVPIEAVRVPIEAVRVPIEAVRVPMEVMIDLWKPRECFRGHQKYCTVEERGEIMLIVYVNKTRCRIENGESEKR